MSKWSLRAGSVVVTLSIFLLWQIVTAIKLVQPIFLPSPSATFANLWRGLTQGDLLVLTLSTMERMIYGWMLASLGGILLGALIGLSARARYWLGPTLELLRPLPASTLLPVGIALFGLQPGMLLGIVAVGADAPFFSRLSTASARSILACTRSREILASGRPRLRSSSGCPTLCRMPSPECVYR